MTVGEGLFYGAIILGLVGLYAATKDRWRWKRIVKWGIGLPAVLLILGVAGAWAYKTYEDRPRLQKSFGGITLASTEADVRFAKGEASTKVQEGLWFYYAGSGSAKPESAGYLVRFKNKKVRYIAYLASPDQIVTPDLHGFTIGTPYEIVLEKLGPPDHASTSDDGLQRMVSYGKLNTFYTFERGQVRDLGIYDSTTGPMKFSKAASSTDGHASKAAGASNEPQELRGSTVAPILDHCAPDLSRTERLKRLAQHGAVRETGTGHYEASERSVAFFEGKLVYCR